MLKAIPNDSKKYSLLAISGVPDSRVIGGTLEGERDQQKGKSGGWGYGLRIGKAAKPITVSNVISKKMWGDGFYVQDAEGVALLRRPRRCQPPQGLSIVQANGLLVWNSVFKNPAGTRPCAGIDFEPDRVEQKITDVPIVGSKFIDNRALASWWLARRRASLRSR